MANRTTWIDLTDFIDWQGHFTGIQRVEYELAKRFKERPDTRFYYYNPLTNSFHKTDFSIIEKKAEVASGARIQVASTQDMRIRTKVANRFKRVLPEDFKEPLRRVKRRIQRTSEMIPAEPSHPFGDGDLVLVLGGNWGFGTYMPSLKKVLKKNSSIKFAHVLFDFIPVMQPGYFPGGLEDTFGTYKKHVLEVADVCLSISEYTKKDGLLFAKKHGIKNPNIVPFRLGDDFAKLEPKRPAGIDHVKPGEFIFMGGTMEIRKNHQLIYYAYKLAKQKGLALPKLVISGKQGWLADSTAHLFKYDPDMSDVSVLYAADNEMAWLYQNCHFSIYASFYEGWGLPIAESLNYGAYCLAPNTSSMPEVAGDLIDYFSPFDSHECLDKIVATMKKKPSELKKRASKYKVTTWDDTYEEVLDILKKNT